ncbi:hypothetical protein [Mucilaginibacter lacusdianchii]|uniref:hypothetical protein n=1 Tax=Mucilaginibacter lacusdianchii TaxID=2684211 RepID=UPI00131AD915|nr:hypothetical protein [Mucilaginibacter sp. JXJ CY 39]
MNSTLPKTPDTYQQMVLSGLDYVPVSAPTPKESWDSSVRTVAIALAAKAPYVGSLVSFIIKSFWKEAKADVWAQISNNVARMIDLKLLEFEITRDGSELTAIKSDMTSYVLAKNDSEKRILLSICLSKCTELYYKLIKSQHKAQLIPFTIGFSQLHLGLLKERVDYGAELFGEYDENWGYDLQRQIESYRTFFQENIPDLLKWRADQIIYQNTINGILFKDTKVAIYDQFLNVSFNKTGDFVDGKEYLKNELNQVKANWISQWTTSFADAYSTFFYTNRLLPGSADDAPQIDPNFKKLTIGPFCPGNDNVLPPLKPANDNQAPGKIKEVIYNYGDNLDSFVVNFTDHEGVRCTKIGGSKSKQISIDPNKKIATIRFYYTPSFYKSPLRSINFVYDDVTETETAMSEKSSNLKFYEVKIPADYTVTNIKSVRDSNSSTADFFYWFWVDIEFHPFDGSK